ncbi:MAG: hypothetical protein ACP5K9_00360 [Candidatus Micrarchaeia archaeon]
MITSMEISKVEGERSSAEGIANMRFNINFDNVSTSEDTVEVTYTFLATYEGTAGSQNIGQIKISGKIKSKENKKDSEEIASTWKNKKTLPIKFAENLINLINFECGSRGTLVAYSLGLVPPLPLTRATLQETPNNKPAA